MTGQKLRQLAFGIGAIVSAGLILAGIPGSGNPDFQGGLIVGGVALLLGSVIGFLQSSKIDPSHRSPSEVNPHRPAIGTPPEGNPVLPMFIVLAILCAPGIVSLFAVQKSDDSYGFSGLVVLFFACPLAGIAAVSVTLPTMPPMSSLARVAASLGLCLIYMIATVAIAFGICSTAGV